MKRRKSVSLLLAGATTVAMLTGPVQAAEAPSPQELAAARLQSEGLMKGDENGELHLEDDLTRAELACLISPIILNPEHVAWETDWYTRMCTTNFNDVPEWAQVAVGVCTSMGTMAGYGDGLFGPQTRSARKWPAQSCFATWNRMAGPTIPPVKRQRNWGLPQRDRWKETPSPVGIWLSC